MFFSSIIKSGNFTFAAESEKELYEWLTEIQAVSDKLITSNLNQGSSDGKTYGKVTCLQPEVQAIVDRTCNALCADCGSRGIKEKKKYFYLINTQLFVLSILVHLYVFLSFPMLYN